MKKCFKCGIEKELDEFYKHPKMADGHLNKCKDCNKKDVKDNYLIKATNDEWVAKERIRGREKYHRLNYVHSPWNERKKSLFWITSEYKGLRKWVSDRVNITDFDEIHHWNYHKIKDFFILNRKTHSQIHKLIKVDEVTGLCVTNDGRILDTKQKHLNFIYSIMIDKGYKEFNIGIYDFTKTH
jgi:hypothetical protein